MRCRTDAPPARARAIFYARNGKPLIRIVPIYYMHACVDASHHMSERARVYGIYTFGYYGYAEGEEGKLLDGSTSEKFEILAERERRAEYVGSRDLLSFT